MSVESHEAALFYHARGATASSTGISTGISTALGAAARVEPGCADLLAAAARVEPGCADLLAAAARVESVWALRLAAAIGDPPTSHKRCTITVAEWFAVVLLARKGLFGGCHGKANRHRIFRIVF